MWSHYADKHQGICLKFDMDLDKPFFTIPLKVVYPNEYPIFDFLATENRQAKNAQLLVGTKSNDWKYEDEIRIIKYKQSYGSFRGEMQFRKSALIEVVFGYRTDGKKISDLMVLMRKLGYGCVFSRVILKKNEFGIEKIVIK